MKNKKKVAVIGGTGKSGKYLVQQLLNKEYSLRLLLRNPARFTVPNSPAEVIVGDAKDYYAIRTLLNECDAVISALGMGVPPDEPTKFSQATTNIIKAMQECNVRRYIVIAGLNVDTPDDKKSRFTADATEWMKKSFPISTADKQKEYHILSESSVAWTLVRLPLIKQTDLNSEITVSLHDCPGNEISATALANFLIGQLDDDRFIKKAPFIANA
jgi:putative NADH-flavin reductase